MTDRLQFLLADDFHINRRNFAALFDFIKLHRVPTGVHRRHDELKRCLGSYGDRALLTPYVRGLERLDAAALFELDHSYRNTPLRLFPLYRSEALAFALAQRSHWHDMPSSREDRAIFERMHAHDRDVLLGNAAAAMFWIDHFAELYAEQGLRYSHAFVFGGSMTYTRVLMQLCKLSETKCMVLESSFTGHQFYAEERYAPLAASPDIQHPAVRASLLAELEGTAGAESGISAHALMTSATNKNVVQPDEPVYVQFPEQRRPELLIVGQVVNDFSVIEQRRCPLSSLAFYRDLIRRCLQQTEYNLIFKAHPWEDRKLHVNRAFTREQISELRDQLSPEQQARLVVLDSANLLSLGKRVDRVALLNSQAGLELAYHCGLQPSTFGHPYYAGAGFTDDFPDIESFLDDVRVGGARAMLGLDGFEQLVRFLQCFLGVHCITNGPHGAAQLARRLAIGPLHGAREDPELAQSFRQLAAKGRKLLRSPKRFVRDSSLVRRLLKPD